MSESRAGTGVLLINVGTPEAPRPREVRRYLREFLCDPRVLDVNPVARWLLVHLAILPFRSRASANLYRKIWRPEGSPLFVHSHALARRIGALLQEDFHVVPAMRYGRPSIGDGLNALRNRGVRDVVAFPLYPQYAASTTGSALAEVYRAGTRAWTVPSLSVVPPFYDDPGLAEAHASVGRPVLRDLRPDHVLLSFHGLPERQIRKSDPSGSHCLVGRDCCGRIGAANRDCYRAQCFETARRIASVLELDPDRWSVSFQSRFGRTPWIGPHTDLALEELAASGKRRVAVFCPSFVADCLETLEEIGIRAKESFLSRGGEAFRVVPSLNEEPLWVETAARLIRGARPAGLAA